MNQHNKFAPPKADVADIAAPKLATSDTEPWILQCWNGRAPLWKAFWLVGVLGQLIALWGTYEVLFLILRFVPSAVAFEAVMLAAIAVFASVSVWRCAVNAKRPQLGTLARVAVGFYIGAQAILLIRAAI